MCIKKKCCLTKRASDLIRQRKRIIYERKSNNPESFTCKTLSKSLGLIIMSIPNGFNCIHNILYEYIKCIIHIIFNDRSFFFGIRKPIYLSVVCK